MKTITILLVLVCSVSLAHTDAEKGRYVDGILMRTMYAASDDSWALEGRDPDPHNVLGSWEGFLGRPGGEGWTSGWSMAERRAAFDWYLERLTTTNCCSMSSMDKGKVLIAFATCKKFSYTNAVSMLRGAALNPNCVHRDLAIEVGVDCGDVSHQSTDFVENIFTNRVGFTTEERGLAAGLYADKVKNLNPEGRVATSNVFYAVGMFYRNRLLDSVACYAIDDLLCAKLIGYASSSNRLETLKYILSLQGLDNEIRTEFTATTNQLLSSGRPLVQLTIGEGGDE